MSRLSLLALVHRALHFARHSQHHGEKELGREMLFSIALDAHQKLKMRLVFE